MSIYFTADLHLNHWTTSERNIIKYCSRPFQDIEEMNNTLITNWNSIVKAEDTVYHLGDFCLRNDRTVAYWEANLNGKIVHIIGNHDHKIKGLSSAIIRLLGRETFLSHYPPTIIPASCCMALCGHIHDRWKGKLLEGKPVINVGVDVWDYAPVEPNKIIGLADKLRSEAPE